MQSHITFIAKAIRYLSTFFSYKIDFIITWIRLYSNNALFQDFNTTGIPYVMVSRNGEFAIGANFSMNNCINGNPIGCVQPCMFVVGNEAKLTIGKNVGISSTAIVAHTSIIIGNNVKIGGGVCIYDTDFHSLNATMRIDPKLDIKNIASIPIAIGDNVFIGAHSTILKGVTIGENSIIGACSVVTKDIPRNEIWAGNPAKFIKKIKIDEQRVVTV